MCASTELEEKALDINSLNSQFDRISYSTDQISTQNNVTGEIRDMRLVNNCGQVPPTITALKKSLRSEVGITGITPLSDYVFPEDRTGVEHTRIYVLAEHDGIDSDASVHKTEDILHVSKATTSNSVLALEFDSEVPVTSFNIDTPTITRVNEDYLSSIALQAIGDINYLVGVPRNGADCDQSHKGKMPCSGVIGSKNFSGGFNNTSRKRPASIMENCRYNSSFGIGDELSQALAPAFKQVHEEDLFDNRTNLCSMQQISGLLYGLPEQLLPDSGSCFVKENWDTSYSKSEPLLEAVVASASRSHQSALTIADDIFPRTLSGMGSEISVQNSAKCCSSQDHSSHGFLKGFHDESSISGESITLKNIVQYPITLSTSGNGSTTTSMSVKAGNKISEGLPKVTRKRARSGESMRPRPRDRQQIQDRLRELREIIPNGSKCSIDALLEKTVGHMLFLQNVAQHIDDLKKNNGSNDDAESGASWAFELHGDKTGHPILVKNLNQPRQLLVEIYCKQRSHFLEIADEIRNLGLSILKGVMESRSDKIWARFIVEANRDVHRMHIMMSLMHLLHVNDDCSSSMAMDSQSDPSRYQQTVGVSNSLQTQNATNFNKIT